MKKGKLIERLETLTKPPADGTTNWKDAGEVLNLLIIMRDGLVKLTKELKEE